MHGMTSKMISEIEKLKKQMDSLSTSLLTYIALKNIPLEERWKVFSEATPSLFKNEDWIQHYYINEQEVNTENYNRSQIIDNVDMIDILEDNVGWVDEYTQEHIDTLKEEILRSGVRTWRFDW